MSLPAVPPFCESFVQPACNRLRRRGFPATRHVHKSLVSACHHLSHHSRDDFPKPTGRIGRLAMSNQEVIVHPPLQVTGCCGAVGNFHSTFGRACLVRCLRKLHPTRRGTARHRWSTHKSAFLPHCTQCDYLPTFPFVVEKLHVWSRIRAQSCPGGRALETPTHLHPCRPIRAATRRRHSSWWILLTRAEGLKDRPSPGQKLSQ